jgi:hypothetical protein
MVKLRPAQSRGKSEIMDLLILSKIMDFTPALLLKSKISDTFNQSIISNFPLPSFRGRLPRQGGRQVPGDSGGSQGTTAGLLGTTTD